MEKPVQMMFKKSTFKLTYIGEISTQILVLPYVGKELNMVILLPSESTDLNTVTSQPWPRGVSSGSLLGTGLWELVCSRQAAPGPQGTVCGSQWKVPGVALLQTLRSTFSSRWRRP